jgi:UDP-glucose:glycoprotein glucosyltransferase
LIQDFISLEKKASSWTDHQLYNEAVRVISSLGKDQTNFFKIALAVHEAAPRIEDYNQYYTESIVPSLVTYNEQCEVWAQTSNNQFCDYQEFLKAFKDIDDSEETFKLLPFDHVIYPSFEKSSKKTVVLYTNKFSSKFAEFHDYLTGAVDEHGITYVIRYRPSLSNVAPGSPLYLSGYGVEMALKRTDYLVIDDRNSQGKIYYL